MQTATTPTLTDLLVRILVIATRMLRDIHVHTSAASVLKTILAANLAGARIGRAIRLATLLIRRIHTHGLLPFAPARPARTTQPTPRPGHTQNGHTPGTPRFNPGNADAAFVRRPIHTVIAAITRELYLAAQIMDVPLPQSLQTLCLQAALASSALPTTPEDVTPADITPADVTPNDVTQPPPPATPQTPNPETSAPTPIPTPAPTPTPTQTLEL